MNVRLHNKKFFFRNRLRDLYNMCRPVLAVLSVCLVFSSCDYTRVPYENASLNGCYSMGDSVFHQFWFDGAAEFTEIYWTEISGEVYYSGTYQVSDHELYLDYYGYDPEVYRLNLYSNGFTLDGGAPYYYIGEECW